VLNILSNSASNEPSLLGIDDFLPETNFEDNIDDDPLLLIITV